MRARFIVCISMLLLIGSAARADETFTYTSPTYTTYTNGNSSLLGTSLTVTVTLSCSGPCADGTYYGSQISSLTMTSGPLSFTPSVPGEQDITLTNGLVSSWNIYEDGDEFGSAGGAPNGDRTYNEVSYFDCGLAPPPICFVGAQVTETLLDVPGLGWSLVGAPAPISGAGILPALAIIALCLFLRRQRTKLIPLPT
jgi:hypothetical protein